MLETICFFCLVRDLGENILEFDFYGYFDWFSQSYVSLNLIIFKKLFIKFESDSNLSLSKHHCVTYFFVIFDSS